MRPSNEYDVAIFANHPVLVMLTGSVDLNLRQTRGGEENDGEEKRTIERRRGERYRGEEENDIEEKRRTI
jgi:hypothetical protein